MGNKQKILLSYIGGISFGEKACFKIRRDPTKLCIIETIPRYLFINQPMIYRVLLLFSGGLTLPALLTRGVQSNEEPVHKFMTPNCMIDQALLKFSRRANPLIQLRTHFLCMKRYLLVACQYYTGSSHSVVPTHSSEIRSLCLMK